MQHTLHSAEFCTFSYLDVQMLNIQISKCLEVVVRIELLDVLNYRLFHQLTHFPIGVPVVRI
jgi:hypothetical protein